MVRRAVRRGDMMQGALDRVLTTLCLVVAAVVIALQLGLLKPAQRVTNKPQWETITGLATSVGVTEHSQGVASLVVIEYSDFECPFCGMYARGTYNDIVTTFVRTNRVQYVFRHFPIERAHPFAVTAAAAAECAGKQGRFWQMHDALFANQAGLARPDLVKHGRELGLDLGTLNECIESAGPTIVRGHQSEALRLGVNSTPTFLVGRRAQQGSEVSLQRRLRGLLPREDIEAELERLLGASRVASTRGTQGTASRH